MSIDYHINFLLAVVIRLVILCIRTNDIKLILAVNKNVMLICLEVCVKNPSKKARPLI
jgi:hypothetical protein